MVAFVVSYNNTEVDNLNGTVGNTPANWTLGGTLSSFQYGNDLNPQEGTTVAQILSNGAGRGFARRDLGAGNTFDLTLNDLTWWYFYVKGKGDAILTDIPGSGEWPVSVRVYSDASPGTNWAEWDLAGNDTLIASWNFFTISGDTPTRTNGTVPTYTAIRHVEFRFDFARSTAGGFLSSDEPTGLDFIKYGNTITVTGGDGVDPAGTPDDLFAWSEGDPADRVNDPAWGLVIKEDVFNSILAALDFGNGTAATEFEAQNQFFLNRSFSDTVAHNIRVRNNATVTSGTKDVGTQATYAIEGCQFVTPAVAEDGSTGIPTSDFIVESGGTFLGYNTKIFRYDLIDFNDASCELIGCDLANNDFVRIDAALLIQDCLIHDAVGSGFAGAISAAATFINTQIFNNTRGLDFEANITVRNYIATDNTDDLDLSSSADIVLVDSIFDPNRILGTGTVSEQYSWNVNVTKGGSPVNGATVVGFNDADAKIIDETTNASGVLASDLDVEAALHTVTAGSTVTTARNPYDIRILNYPDVDVLFGKDFAARSTNEGFLETDTVITETNRATVQAYPGITFTHGSLNIALSSGTWNPQRLYDRAKDERVANPQAATFKFIDSVDGINFVQAYDVDVTNISFDGGGARYDGDWSAGAGAAQLSNIQVANLNLLAGASSTLNNVDVTGTLDFSVAGTYDLTDCTVNEVTNSSGGAVTLNLLGDSTVAINTGPNITLNQLRQLTLTNLKDFTEVRVYAQGTTTELAGVEDATDGTPDNRSVTFGLQAGTFVDIRFANNEWLVPDRNSILNFEWPFSDSTIPITQVFDPNFVG